MIIAMKNWKHFLCLCLLIAGLGGLYSCEPENNGQGPSGDPVVQPSEEPSVEPSQEPSVESDDPTVDPSDEPTVDPSEEFSVDPSGNPPQDGGDTEDVSFDPWN